MRNLHQRTHRFIICVLLIVVWLTSSGGGGCGGGGGGSRQSSGPGIVEINLFDLTIRKSGTGNGEVATTNTELCGFNIPECRIPFNEGTLLTLTAIPAFNSEFVEWNGACSGRGECVVVMDYYKTVIARFRLRH